MSFNTTAVIYADPDLYPPVINATQVLGRCGVVCRVVSREYSRPVLPADNDLYPDNTYVRRIRLPNANSLFQYLYFIAASLRETSNQTDIIIGYDMHGLIPARLVASFTNVPLVYHCHDYVENGSAQTFGGRVVKWLEQRIAPTADLVIVPDRERAAVMVDQLRLRRAPLVVANAPLTAPEPSTRLRDTLAAQGKSFSRIVFRQGRIGPNHALDVTLRSMPMWADPTWGFVIMGPAEPSFRDHLNTLAASLGVADRFVILPAVAYPQVAHYTVGADLGHGLYEPNHVNNRYITMASNKIMEYIAAGLPALLSETSGSRALLETYQVGATADVDSPESIAQTVNTILSDPRLSERMREESKRAFHEELNYTHQYAPVIERLQQLIADRIRRHGKSSSESARPN